MLIQAVENLIFFCKIKKSPKAEIDTLRDLVFYLLTINVWLKEFSPETTLTK
jgi:hypothetical protein